MKHAYLSFFLVCLVILGNHREATAQPTVEEFKQTLEGQLQKLK